MNNRKPLLLTLILGINGGLHTFSGMEGSLNREGLAFLVWRQIAKLTPKHSVVGLNVTKVANS